MADLLTVTFDRYEDDTPYLVVARRNPDGTIEIINGIKGEAAIDLYNTLTSWIVLDDGEEDA